LVRGCLAEIAFGAVIGRGPEAHQLGHTRSRFYSRLPAKPCRRAAAAINDAADNGALRQGRVLARPIGVVLGRDHAVGIVMLNEASAEFARERRRLGVGIECHADNHARIEVEIGKNRRLDLPIVEPLPHIDKPLAEIIVGDMYFRG
jgi:hypothetical protein